MLDEPVEKIATRNMFYDENGKHVRTKKEILDEAGQLRSGCKIIPKDEVYERNIFTIKDSRFKSDGFLNEVKRSYTDLINIYVKDDKQNLKVFDRNGVYLPTKKIGKNNPKAEQIKTDNQYRVMWNQTVDRALISGVPEGQILEKHIIGENGIGYTLGEDGMYYPDLQIPESTHYEIGKYGRMRWEYLKNHRRGEYIKLLMDGRLNEYLHEIDTQCYEKVELLVEQMKAGTGIMEELKATDQMKWVGLMNNVRSSAEEIVLKELIYV